MKVFVVYGRLSRQLVPLFIIASTYGLLQLMKKGKFAKQLALGIIIIICIQAVINFRSSFQIIYPREFIERAQEQYPRFKMSIKRTNSGAPFICKYYNPDSTPTNRSRRCL